MSRLMAQGVSQEFVESKIQFMADVHLWPERQTVDPIGWLNNFSDSERPYALNLLNVFLYFNESLVDALFRAAFHALSSQIAATATSLAEAKSRWRDFLANVHVSYVEGERPNLTDSGLLFMRKARQVLGIDEKRMRSPETALKRAASEPISALVLFDDFVGSGNQMKTSWHRLQFLDASTSSSLEQISESGTQVIYVPLVATVHGLRALQTECRGLIVSPAHILDMGYSLTDPNCILWPAALKASAQTFLFEASKRAGIVDEYEYGWKGFHDLSLGLAFSHSVPDATLPLFFWDQRNWTPLIRRT